MLILDQNSMSGTNVAHFYLQEKELQCFHHNLEKATSSSLQKNVQAVMKKCSIEKEWACT